MAVDERSGVSFSVPQGTLPWQPILWAKLTRNPHLCAINRSVVWDPWMAAINKNVVLIGLCWVQANKLPDSMEAGRPINKKQVAGISGWASDRLCLASS